MTDKTAEVTGLVTQETQETQEEIINPDGQEQKETQETETESTEPKSDEESASEKEAPVKETAKEEAKSDTIRRKQTAQERIDEITRARRTAERDAEYWKSRALQAPQPQVQKPAVDQFTTPRPKLEHFESAEQYEDALISWHDQKKSYQEQQKEQEKKLVSQQEEQAKLERQFLERAEKARTEYPDFDDVIASPVFTPAMREMIFLSEHGAELAYYLGLPEHKTVANKIAQMPIHQQVYELGGLEKEIILSQKIKQKTSAPPPIKPVGSGAGELKKDPSKMTDEEWFAWDRQQRLEKLKKTKAV